MPKGKQFDEEFERKHPRADAGKFGSGGGGAEPKAAFISTPVVPSVGNDSPAPIVFGPDNNVIRGSIGDFPITSMESGIVEKTSKKTAAMLEDAFSDPDIQKTLRQAGIKGVRFDKKRGPGKPKEWTGGMLGGMLIVHPRTAESIAKSKVAVRREHGIKRIINHEAGHAMWKNVNPELKSEFTNEIAKHPEIVDTVRGIVNIKPPSDAFDPDEKKRAISEVHAELNAMRLYDAPGYSRLPEGVRATAAKITDAADVLADHSGKGFGQFKPALADLTVAKLAPISERFNALKDDDAAIDAILAKGAAKASETGAPILASAYEALGLLR